MTPLAPPQPRWGPPAAGDGPVAAPGPRPAADPGGPGRSATGGSETGGRPWRAPGGLGASWPAVSPISPFGSPGPGGPGGSGGPEGLRARGAGDSAAAGRSGWILGAKAEENVAKGATAMLKTDSAKELGPAATGPLESREPTRIVLVHHAPERFPAAALSQVAMALGSLRHVAPLPRNDDARGLSSVLFAFEDLRHARGFMQLLLQQPAAWGLRAEQIGYGLPSALRQRFSGDPQLWRLCADQGDLLVAGWTGDKDALWALLSQLGKVRLLRDATAAETTVVARLRSHSGAPAAADATSAGKRTYAAEFFDARAGVAAAASMQNAYPGLLVLANADALVQTLQATAAVPAAAPERKAADSGGSSPAAAFWAATPTTSPASKGSLTDSVEKPLQGLTLPRPREMARAPSVPGERSAHARTRSDANNDSVASWTALTSSLADLSKCVARFSPQASPVAPSATGNSPAESPVPAPSPPPLPATPRDALAQYLSDGGTADDVVALVEQLQRARLTATSASAATHAEPAGERQRYMAQLKSRIASLGPKADPSAWSLGSSFPSGSGVAAKQHYIPCNNEVNLYKVIMGFDRRTTFMIRNIPNKYSQVMLMEFLDETHKGEYDFLYLRIDFRNQCNVGYAFINFIDVSSLVTFAEKVVGKRWTRFNSDKLCMLSYANIQGKSALIEKFRNSSVMLEDASYRPKIFYSSGPLRGQEEPFPPPTIPLRRTAGGSSGLLSSSTPASPALEIVEPWGAVARPAAADVSPRPLRGSRQHRHARSRSDGTRLSQRSAAPLSGSSLSRWGDAT